ncbi:MAG: hypothetical protein HFH82_06720 [Lachnospiraceae bacterium]|nr:hypothetical protein [Lachnospiraceae bacterium]
MKKEKHCKSGKRLRLIPLILGVYGAFLGFGLVAIGLAELKEGIGIVRLLMGIGMAGFGLLGVWDGVRDLVRPNKKTQPGAVSQFILTDTSGKRSSLVTSEALREQMRILVESEEHKSFDIKIVPHLSAGEYGLLNQILCIYYDTVILAAFLEMPNAEYKIYRKRTEPDLALKWLQQLLAGSLDFSEWESVERKAGQEEETEGQNEEYGSWGEVAPSTDEAEAQRESVESFWQQLLSDQSVQLNYWHRLLVIFGESWHNEHKFFSVRDVELAIEGIHEGKYQKVFLEWGMKAFDLFPGIQDEVMVIWCTNNTGKGDVRFLAKEGTVTQVKFWLVSYLEHGFLEEMSGWTDITAQIEKEKGKGKMKHGKIF